jgi:putative sterol carrier protein
MAGYKNKEEMEAVVKRFIENMSKDEAIIKRSKGLKVTMGFEIPDMDLKFHTDFMDGVVSGGIGDADPPSMVFLEMDSEIFDGMFTGEIDGASAAMSGSMSFSGDMSAAMGLQVLQEDMGRVYLASKN